MFGVAVVVLSLTLLLGAILVPDVGEVELLKRLLYANAGAENGTLRLFKNNITPAESDTAGTFTAADFTGAASLTLTSTQAAGTWAVPTTATGLTTSTYQTNLGPLVNTGAVQTVYGVFVVGATSTVLWYSDLFAASRTLNTNDSIQYTPKIGLD
jgi:hypothetical protein